MGASHTTGGQRNYLDQWDFFDVPVPPLLPSNTTGTRNKVINMSDVISVLSYIGTSAGNPNQANFAGAKYGSDLNSNGKLDGSEYDRSPSATPGQPWRSTAPNGAVSIQDALVALSGVGDNCS